MKAVAAFARKNETSRNAVQQTNRYRPMQRLTYREATAFTCRLTQVNVPP